MYLLQYLLCHQQLHYPHLHVICSKEKYKTRNLRFPKDPDKLAWHFSLEVLEAFDSLSHIYLILYVVSEMEMQKYYFMNKLSIVNRRNFISFFFFFCFVMKMICCNLICIVMYILNHVILKQMQKIK